MKYEKCNFFKQSFLYTMLIRQLTAFGRHAGAFVPGTDDRIRYIDLVSTELKNDKV
jgi:hypothetical protein